MTVLPGAATFVAPESPGTAPRHRNIPRGRNQLHTIFERHFDEFWRVYDEKYAATYGMFRLDRIRDILAHLVKTGRAPPGFDPALLI